MSGMGQLVLDEAKFRGHYNREPFLVGHRLGDHPLMQLPNLITLAKRMPAEKVLYRLGQVPVDADFDRVTDQYRGQLTLDEALDLIEQKRSIVTLNTPEIDGEYGPFIASLVDEFRPLIEPAEGSINWFATYFFISAPGAVTPYHMDREMNFLLQIRGDKEVRLWDPGDDAIMTEVQKERLFARWDSARPGYRDGFDARARVYRLEPGIGVHHPFIAPHAVTTGSKVSISLAVTFRTDASDRRAAVYRLNYSLRRMGLRPTRVGASPWRDAIKGRTVMAVRRVTRGFGRPTAPA
jgi:hypothetical protein